jgi:hypothetical protein
MGAAPNADCPAPICTTKDHPLVQVGGGSKRVPYSTRSEPPSVLHVRADCGGRLFAAKLHVDLRINCSITCWRMIPSCWLSSASAVSTLSDPAVAGYSAHRVTICHELRHSDQLITSEHGGTDRLAILARQASPALHRSTPCRPANIPGGSNWSPCSTRPAVVSASRESGLRRSPLRGETRHRSSLSPASGVRFSVDDFIRFIGIDFV